MSAPAEQTQRQPLTTPLPNRVYGWFWFGFFAAVSYAVGPGIIISEPPVNPVSSVLGTIFGSGMLSLLATLLLMLGTVIFGEIIRQRRVSQNFTIWLAAGIAVGMTLFSSRFCCLPRWPYLHFLHLADRGIESV